MTRRAIRGVLSSFLGAYVSRYNDFNGYWLFGFLVTDLSELWINLLVPVSIELDGPLGLTHHFAMTKFADQLTKSGLVRSQVRQASLTIRKLPEQSFGEINGVSCAGYNVCFSAEAVMEGGRQYMRELVVFVAPHNAAVERRSAPSRQ